MFYALTEMPGTSSIKGTIQSTAITEKNVEKHKFILAHPDFSKVAVTSHLKLPRDKVLVPRGYDDGERSYDNNHPLRFVREFLLTRDERGQVFFARADRSRRFFEMPEGSMPIGVVHVAVSLAQPDQFGLRNPPERSGLKEGLWRVGRAEFYAEGELGDLWLLNALLARRKDFAWAVENIPPSTALSKAKELLGDFVQRSDRIVDYIEAQVPASRDKPAAVNKITEVMIYDLFSRRYGSPGKKRAEDLLAWGISDSGQPNFSSSDSMDFWVCTRIRRAMVRGESIDMRHLANAVLRASPVFEVKPDAPFFICPDRYCLVDKTRLEQLPRGDSRISTLRRIVPASTSEWVSKSALEPLWRENVALRHDDRHSTTVLKPGVWYALLNDSGEVYKLGFSEYFHHMVQIANPHDVILMAPALNVERDFRNRDNPTIPFIGVDFDCPDLDRIGEMFEAMSPEWDSGDATVPPSVISGIVAALVRRLRETGTAQKEWGPEQNGCLTVLHVLPVWLASMTTGYDKLGLRCEFQKLIRTLLPKEIGGIEFAESADEKFAGTIEYLDTVWAMISLTGQDAEVVLAEAAPERLWTDAARFGLGDRTPDWIVEEAA